MAEALTGSLNNKLPFSISDSFPSKMNLRDCCLKTIQTLAHINTMMVCGSCKQIIKTFKDERAYRNYVKFCQSRSRSITTGLYNNEYFVAFL